MDRRSPESLRRVVLTGAPGAGKSTAVRELGTSPAWALWRKSFGGVTVVPEASTQIYTGRDTRWDRLDEHGRREVQREIYQCQRRQEAWLAAEAVAAGHGLLLLDRGVLDGAAYWPDGPDAYWLDLGVDVADELARYDRVVLMETSATLGLYDGAASNAVRFEDAEAAVANGLLLAQLWARHTDVVVVGASADFSDKLAHVARAIAGTPRRKSAGA